MFASHSPNTRIILMFHFRCLDPIARTGILRGGVLYVFIFRGINFLKDRLRLDFTILTTNCFRFRETGTQTGSKTSVLRFVASYLFDFEFCNFHDLPTLIFPVTVLLLSSSFFRGDVLRNATYAFPDFYAPPPRYWLEGQTDEAFLADQRELKKMVGIRTLKPTCQCRVRL